MLILRIILIKNVLRKYKLYYVILDTEFIMLGSFLQIIDYINRHILINNK